MLSEHILENKFGQSPIFIASTLLKDGGAVDCVSSVSLLKEAIHVIGCGYEHKTDWGKEVLFQNLLLKFSMLKRLMFIPLETFK